MRLPIILAFVFSVTASCMLRQPPAAMASSLTPCDDTQRDGDYDHRDNRSTPPPQAQNPISPRLDPHGKDPHSEVHDDNLPARNAGKYFQ